MNERVNETTRPNGSAAGDKNLYICDRCKGVTVVIHRDPGTTPMFMSCRQRRLTASGEPGEYCTARAVSAMYPAEPWPEGVPSEPEYEWCRPTDQEIKNAAPEHREYLELGGLELRKIGDQSGQAHRVPGQRFMTRRERRQKRKAARKRGRGYTK